MATRSDLHSYKGMAQTNAGSAAQKVTPQPTGGFSQIHSRGGGEGGGQAMSVLLSWHEKVRVTSYRQSRNILPILCLCSHVLIAPLTPHQLVEIAGPGSIMRVMTDRRTV